MHPYSWVNEDILNGDHKNKKCKKRKYLYDKNHEITEDNLMETWFDIVEEVLSRMNKVQKNIKNNEKLLGHKSTDEDEKSNLTDYEEDGSPKRKNAKKFIEVINMNELQKRREMSDQELMERQYCALRIAEYIETSML